MLRRIIIVPWFVIFFATSWLLAQTPSRVKYECDVEQSAITDEIPHSGRVKVLWVICAPDSGALAPLEHCLSTGLAGVKMASA